jgi:RHS repeat-associated protein
VPEGDSAFLTVRANGDLALFFIPLPWNPDTYILTDPDGVRYTYDQVEGLIEIRDPNGNRVSFTETAITHSAGPELRLGRDGAGRITRLEAPDGQSWGYAYDDHGDLVRVTYPGDIVATLGYAANRPHFLETINDPLRGRHQRTEYDADGRVVAVLDAQGNRREQHWDPGSFAGTFTDARGNVTRLTYNARGNITRREDPLGGVTTWEYQDPDDPDRLSASTDPRSYRTTYQYDAQGNVLSRNTPIARTTYTYDAGNRVTRIAHRTGGVETFEYDARGNMTRQQSQRGELNFTRTATGLLASVLDGEGGLTRIEYDGGRNLPLRIIQADGSARHFTHDASGRLTAYTDPLGGTTRYEYDAAGRLVRETDPAGAETQTAYDAVFAQQPATVTDPAGRVTRFAYDLLGRLEQVSAPGGATTRYEYDAEGNRTAIIDPLGHRHTFRYDAMSQLIEETDPRGNKQSYRYDLAGNRIEIVDRNGRRRAFAHDAHNRVTEERWLHPTEDTVLRTITYGYDRIDQLSSVSDPDAVIRLQPMAVPGGPNLAEEAVYTGAPERRLAFPVDGAGRRSGVSLTTTSPRLEPALAVGFTRDLAGNLRIITSRNPLPPSTLEDVAFQLQLWRNPRGNVTELRRFADANGARQVSQSHFGYGEPCRCLLDRLEHVVATNQPLPEATLQFTRLPDGTVAALQEGTNVLAFTYDAAGQLTGVTRDGTLVESYAYDASGNRTASHRHGGYATAAANRLTQADPWVLAYDDEGNLLTKSNTVTGAHSTFTWDHRNRLTSVRVVDPLTSPAGTTTAYRYDGLNRRIAVVRDGQTTWTYFDRWQPVVDYLDDETTPWAMYYYGERLDELHAIWRRGEGLFWTLTDHLGTPRRLLDANGVEVAALAYDSFGNPLTATGSQPAAPGRFAFTAREWDAGTGLYHHRLRYYDPDLGRFLSEDPIGFNGGDQNLYRYVRNRPLNAVDPLGLSEATEEGLLKLVAQAAKQAICEAGAEVASVYISAALEIPSAYVSAAVDVASGAACQGGPRPGKPLLPEPPPLTPDEIRLAELLDDAQLPPFRHLSDDAEAAERALDRLMESLRRGGKGD